MIWQQLVNGLAVGAIYSLIALGFTLVYSVLRIVNMAHGHIYMLGAFFGLTAAKLLYQNLYLSLALAMVGAAAVGLAVERLTLRPLRQADPYSAFISTLGLGWALPVVAQMIWGTTMLPYPVGLTPWIWQVGPVTIVFTQVLILAISLVLTYGLWLVVHKTSIGIAMRATSYSVPISQLMGIDVDRVIPFTFAISAALAGAAGVLVAVYYDAVFPTMGFVAGLKAFTAAVIGGIGSVPGAVLGGLLLGLIEGLAAGYLSSGYKDAIAFVILVIVLLVRPTGLFGRDLVQKM
ncbi:MAG: branched-chain amino acid ABC transporter permease [Thermodesulfobacteriota bacterium]